MTLAIAFSAEFTLIVCVGMICDAIKDRHKND